MNGPSVGRKLCHDLVVPAVASVVLTLCAALCVPPALAADAELPKPSSRAVRTIEGWTVRVDDRLLAPPNDTVGRRALQMLESKLTDITFVVPPDRLRKLRSAAIVIDLNCGGLRTMQYHPSEEWLAEHGYARDLAKCVHIPVAADLLTVRNVREQPWVVLHELSHAYHDQVLGFDEPKIREAFEKYRSSGHGEQVLLFDGTRVRHYALTDRMEFFAEMTEAYFGTDDFYPFNRGELKTAEPEIYELMRSVWEP